MADHKDAELLVQLAQWSTMIELEKSMSTMLADEFDPETADATDPVIARALEFFETVGTLTKNDLLDSGLVLDWLWVSGTWERLRPAVERIREKHGVPELFENFESLARLQA